MELLNDSGKKISVLKLKSFVSPWDAAHQYLDSLESKEFFEPNLESSLYKEEVSSIKLKSLKSGYLESWPQPKESEDNLVWYLNDDFSQLRKAKEEVIKQVGIENCKIKIAIIDTGYQEGHPALPDGFDSPQGISFIKSEKNRPAIDKKRGTLGEQDGHGTATMSILAGKYVDIEVEGQRYKGDFGAIPFAKIIPIRICETVALIRASAFVEAVEYAIDQGCEVISMSMAGAPTKAWARIVNKAYENGVIMVTAAGNSWHKGVATVSPKRLLYPARWDRVIAATGVTYNQKPYVMEAQLKLKGGSSENMQGNYGPISAMGSALAAYTPNTTWATMNDKNNPFRLNGGGTSSATPQIAAAAALWLVRYRKEIESILNENPTEKWMKVEMVKKALFSAADNSHPESKKYFGQGILKAFDALKIKPSVSGLEKESTARVTFYGILDLLGLLIRTKSTNNEETAIHGEMFTLEILQEFHNNPNLHKYLDLDFDNKHEFSSKQKDEIKTELLSSENISRRLKEYLSKE